MVSEGLGYRTLRGMLWGYAAKASEFTLAAAFSIFAGRALGPLVYGRYSLFINIITTAVLFSSFGLEAVLNKFIPQFISQGKFLAAKLLYDKILWLRLFIVISVGLSMFIGRSFLSAFFLEESLKQLSFLLFLILLGKGVQNIFIAFFNALLKLKEIAVINTLAQLIGLAMAVSLSLLFRPSLEIILKSVAVATLLSLPMFILFYPKFQGVSVKYPAESPSSRQYFSFGLSVWQINILTFALGSTINILLMGKILKDPLEIGFYSTAILFLYIPGNLLGSWAGIILPAFSEARAKGGEQGLSRAFVSLTKVIFVLLAPVFLFLGRYSDILVVSLFGQRFYPASELIRAYACFAFLGILFTPHLGYNALYVLDKEKTVLAIRFFCGLLNIILVAFLVLPFKSMGVMVAGSLAMLFQTGSEFFAVRRFVPMRYPYAYFFKIALASLLALALIWRFPVRNFAGIITAGLFYVFALAVIFHFVKLLNAQDKEYLGTLHPALGALVKYF